MDAGREVKADWLIGSQGQKGIAHHAACARSPASVCAARACAGSEDPNRRAQCMLSLSSGWMCTTTEPPPTVTLSCWMCAEWHESQERYGERRKHVSLTSTVTYSVGGSPATIVSRSG